MSDVSLMADYRYLPDINHDPCIFFHSPKHPPQAFFGLGLISSVIVKASSGPRYVVSYRPTLTAAKVSHLGYREQAIADDLLAESWCPCISRHDNPDNHAYLAPRS
jgi:hypothetical protein